MVKILALTHTLMPSLHFQGKFHIAYCLSIIYSLFYKLFQLDTKYETTILQNRVAEPGYYGSPAFLLENGSYKVVGFMVGSIEGKDRLVPIRNLIH